MYMHTKFYEAHTLSSIWLKKYLYTQYTLVEGNAQTLLNLVRLYIGT